MANHLPLSWRTLLPGSLILVGLIVTGFTLNAPPARRPLAPVPPGAVRVLSPGKVLAVAFSGKRLFVGGPEGLYELEESTGRLVGRIALPIDPIHIRSLYAQPDGTLWIGHVDGAIRMKKGKFNAWTAKDGLPGGRVNVIRAYSGTVIAGTSGGLAKFDGDNWRPMPENASLASRVVSTLVQSKDGSLWVGSSSDPKGGLTYLHEGRAKIWRSGEGLPHPYVQDIVETASGDVWVATGHMDVGGAACFRASPNDATLVKVVRQVDGLAGAKVRSVGLGPDGRLWFGSENDGLAIETKAGFRVWTMENGLPHNEVTCICASPTGALWIGTINGLLRVPKQEAEGP